MTARRSRPPVAITDAQLEKLRANRARLQRRLAQLDEAIAAAEKEHVRIWRQGESRENALALIASIDQAIAKGYVHRDRAGRVLPTTREVLEVLVREGEVLVEDGRRRGANDPLN